MKKDYWVHPKDPILELDPAINPELLTDDILGLYLAYRTSLKFKPEDIILSYRVEPSVGQHTKAESNQLKIETDNSWIGSNNWVTSPSLSENGHVNFKHVQIFHPLGKVVNAELQTKLNTTRKPRRGKQYTAGETGSADNQTSGATFRIIADVNNRDQSVGINSPRQSGDPENTYNSKHSGALVLLNRESAEYQKGIQLLISYMDHFGIPCDILHLRPDREPDVSVNYSVYIVAHNGFATSRQVAQQLDVLLSQAMDNGIGVISFDKQFGLPFRTSDRLILTDHLEFSPKRHYITELHNASQDFRLFGRLILSQSEYPGATTLIQVKSTPLLVISEQGAARVAIWTNQEWMHSDVLGPMGGLDDCLWRSMVWTAKKPFVMQSLPPIVTMRVDYVAGRGELFKESPF